MQSVVLAEGAAGDVGEQLGPGRGAVRDLLGAVPGEDAVPAVAERHQQGEAVLVGAGGDAVLGLALQADVGEQHRVDHRFAGEGQAEQVADGGVDAVGADRVAGPVGAGGAVAHRFDGDALGVLPQSGDLGAAQDGRAGLHRPVVEQPLGVVLRGEQDEREAGRQVAEVDPDPVEGLQRLDRAAGGDEVVGEAPGVEEFEGAGVHGERPGEVGLGTALLQHGDAQAGRGEVSGQQQAGRPGADHDDVGDGLLLGHVSAPGARTAAGRRAWRFPGPHHRFPGVAL